MIRDSKANIWNTVHHISYFMLCALTSQDSHMAVCFHSSYMSFIETSFMSMDHIICIGVCVVFVCDIVTQDGWKLT